MQLNKLGGELTPSIRKIQSTMTEVIERFKNLGYTPKKGILERTPDVDCYISRYLGPKSNGLDGVADVTEHSLRATDNSTPVQKLSSFKQFGDSENYAMSRSDYNEKGQEVLRIFRDETRFNTEILTEYEYSGDKVSKEINHSLNTLGNGEEYISTTTKTINPETGSYTVETNYYYEKDPMFRTIEHFNAARQNVQTTRIEKWGDYATSTERTLYDPLSHKTTGLEFEYSRVIPDDYEDTYKLIQKAEINPQTDELTKLTCIRVHNGKSTPYITLEIGRAHV